MSSASESHGSISGSRVELLPCPFCGSNDIETNGPCYVQFMCNNCGVQPQDKDSREDAIAAWNRRPQSSPSSADKISDAEVESAAKALYLRLKVSDHMTWDDACANYPGDAMIPAGLRSDARAALEAAAATRRAQSAVVGDGALRTAANGLCEAAEYERARNGYDDEGPGLIVVLAAGIFITIVMIVAAFQFTDWI